MNEPKNDDSIVVKYKFKKDDNFCVKKVTMNVYEEMKKASTIEYCEIIN